MPTFKYILRYYWFLQFLFFQCIVDNSVDKYINDNSCIKSTIILQPKSLNWSSDLLYTAKFNTLRSIRFLFSLFVSIILSQLSSQFINFQTEHIQVFLKNNSSEKRTAAKLQNDWITFSVMFFRRVSSRTACSFLLISKDSSRVMLWLLPLIPP